MRFLRRGLVGVFLLGLTLALFALAGRTVVDAVQERMADDGPGRPAQERVFAVNVTTVEPQTITPILTAFGEAQSRRTIDLRLPVGGTIVEIGENTVDGGRVTQGELIYRLDGAEAEAALARVRADVQDAEANLRDAETRLLLAEDERAAAERQADLQRRALDRQQGLEERGVGTAAAVESAELAVASADQTVLSRRQSLAEAQATRDQAVTRLAREEVNLSEAQRTVGDTTLTAAFDGTLSDIDIVPGLRLTANEQTGQLIDPSLLEVAFRVSTAQYTRLLDDEGRLIRLPVTVRLDVGGVDLTANGEITRESAAVAEGQTGRLIFATLGAAPGFRPGDFVTVQIEEPPLDRVALLPASALGADSTVLVLGEEERLEVAPVTLMRRQGDDILVRASGLAGREVVSERSPLLGDGIRVRPLRTGTAPEQAAMITLTPERRAQLIAIVEANTRMPDEAKARVRTQLEADQVPASMVARLESRMGG
ncbi:efflux RND transporter periplasmic adaptor subunit [Aestuariibius sp. 2305UL40-4]|uniref:efflux RND transporter periplasmic adaptor subunit n=1 Tax=Aestuariibius violaceus TaxID=3234132 RepID=UPI00345E8DF5